MSPGRILRPPEGALHVADQERIVLKRHRDGGTCGRLDALFDDELKGLVPAKVDLLAVAVGPRVGELPGELEEDPE